MLRDLGDIKFMLPVKIYTDAYDAVLDNLFGAIIDEGIDVYSSKCEQNKSLTPTNFLKNDDNYYLILKRRWSRLKKEIGKIFPNL